MHKTGVLFWSVGLLLLALRRLLAQQIMQAAEDAGRPTWQPLP